jgi:hypothetical protein
MNCRLLGSIHINLESVSAWWPDASRSAVAPISDSGVCTEDRCCSCVSRGIGNALIKMTNFHPVYMQYTMFNGLFGKKGTYFHLLLQNVRQLSNVKCPVWAFPRRARTALPIINCMIKMARMSGVCPRRTDHPMSLMVR